MSEHYHNGTNVGSGMVPCRKNCTCSDCTIDRLQAQVAALESENTRLGAVLDSLPADIQTLFGGAAADEFVKSCSEYPRNRAALKQEVSDE